MKKTIKSVIALVLGVSINAVAFAGTNSVTHGGPAPTNAPPVCSTNAPPVHGTNTPPSLGTNTPPVCTNTPPVSPTNSPPELGTNAATALAASAAMFYAAVFPYDANTDGVLDSSEQAALFQALTNGLVPIFSTNQTFSLPPHDATNCVAWIAALYAQIATFDTDKNGALDATEQATLASALEADTVPLPLFAPLLFGGEHHASLAVSATSRLMAGSSSPGRASIWRTTAARPSAPTTGQHPQLARLT